MSVSHATVPRRVPCILGSTNHAAQFTWHDTDLTMNDIRSVEAAKTRFLIAFLEEADLTDAVASEDRPTSSPALSIPPAIVSDLCMDASGFFRAVHCFSTNIDHGFYTTAFRFLVKHRTESSPRRDSPTSIYEWEKLGFVTFHPCAEFFTILCLGIGGSARANLHQRILESKLSVLEAHPLSIHIFILRYTLESFDRAVWSWRDVVRELETSRQHRDFATGQDFHHMHDIARHLIHSTKMLSTALSVVECIVKECDAIDAGSCGRTSSTCLREMHFVSSLMTALLHRSSALERRMENEIALTFHANAQHDTSIASRIALSSQRDGRTTKGISILGMLFLPGTFISALFSMSFFHFTPSADGGLEQWTVSPEFWMYWAVTIPVTVLTVGMWLLLQRWQPRSIYSAIRNLGAPAITFHDRDSKGGHDIV